MLDVINDIIKNNNTYIDIKDDSSLKSKFTIAIEENEVICNEIDEVFNDSEEYFIFYQNKNNLSNKEIIEKIYKKIEESNINEDSKFSYVNLYIMFNKMQEKISFDKYKKAENLKKNIFDKIKKKKSTLDKKNIELNTIFLGNNERESFSIRIYDRIRSLENCKQEYIDNDKKDAGLKINGFVFNSKLKDIVDIYDSIGDKLFEKNIRYSIKDELDVDFHIKKTLEENPDEFWYLNNGITMIIEDDDFKLRKSNSIDINYNRNTTVSVINGAQTISASASYIYQNNNKDIDAKVIFRIIHISKFGMNEDNSSKLDELCTKEINKISISLNRQKPIKQEDIAYATSFVSTINQLSEEIDKKYYFKIGKRSKEINEGYDLLDFAKIVKSYLVQKPGDALTKGAKTLLKVKNGEFEDEGIFKRDIVNDDKPSEIFNRYYKPVNFASILMDKYVEYAKLMEKYVEYDKGKTENYKRIKKSISRYGKLYFIGYVIYILNDKKVDKFREFEFNKDDIDYTNLNNIIEKYIEVFSKFIIEIKKMNSITINDFKKNTLYEEFKSYNQDDEVGNQIKELNEMLKNIYPSKNL